MGLAGLRGIEMKIKGYILLEMVVFILIFSILSLTVLNMDMVSIVKGNKALIKDYELDICRSIIEFYKSDNSNFYSNYEIYFDDFKNIKQEIVTNGLSNFLNSAANGVQTKGQYKLNIEFNLVENLSSIKVTCLNTNLNIKTSIIYYK